MLVNGSIVWVGWMEEMNKSRLFEACAKGAKEVLKVEWNSEGMI